MQLWGIDAQTRLRRQVAQLPNLRWIDDLRAAGDAPVLLLRADYLFEVRTLKALARQSDVVLYCGSDARAAAMQLSTADRVQALHWLNKRAGEPPAALRKIASEALSRFDATLRRAEAPLLEPVEGERRGQLESLLYGNAYKGITDLVTKWLWPAPARRGVRWCADHGITPNAVTTFGLLLVLAAGFAFWQGHYLLGLAMGWLMTWLDTVDGKLARVTVQSSRLGHLLDHGVDLIHPPLWYLLWGFSLVNFQPLWGLD
ncbi:MAG: CDP-alcohol phosphatidyltransferase, partial [Lysobacterales bacterium CG_4_10_14_3_um_filter_64_11]